MDSRRLSSFLQDYLDYVEGLRDGAPLLDVLTDADRRAAEKWIESLEAARGVNPYAERPSTAELLARCRRA